MTWSVPKLAKEKGIAPKKIHIWIKAGELRAANLATSLEQRPRYSIDDEDWKAFELSRQVVPPTKPIRRKRRSTSGKDYFPD